MKKLLDLLNEVNSDNDYSQSTDFIADGLLDSFELLTLITAIEKEYGVKIGGTDLSSANFANLDTIRNLLAEYGFKANV